MKAHPGDIPVTGSLDRADANRTMLDQAKALVNLGQTARYGVYVAKHGQGFAVFLRDRFDQN